MLKDSMKGGNAAFSIEEGREVGMQKLNEDDKPGVSSRTQDMGERKNKIVGDAI